MTLEKKVILYKKQIADKIRINYAFLPKSHVEKNFGLISIST